MESGEDGVPIVLRERGGAIADVYSQAVDRIFVELDKYRCNTAEKSWRSGFLGVDGTRTS